MCVKCTHTRTNVPKNIRVPIVPSAPVRVAIETTFLPLLTQLSLPTTAHHTLPHHTYPLTPPTNHTPTTLRTYVTQYLYTAKTRHPPLHNPHQHTQAPQTTQHTHTPTYRFQYDAARLPKTTSYVLLSYRTTYILLPPGYQPCSHASSHAR